jgi:hypothetical protein
MVVVWWALEKSFVRRGKCGLEGVGLERHLTNVVDDDERSDAYCGCLLLIALTGFNKVHGELRLTILDHAGLTCLRYMANSY